MLENKGRKTKSEPDGDDDDDDLPLSPDELMKKLTKAFGGKVEVIGMPPGGTPKRRKSNAGRAEKSAHAEALQRIREFAMKPREIHEYLDRFVISQDEAKKVLSVAICDHYNHVRRCLEQPKLREKNFAKHNIMLLGPSGVGKTYLMRCIAKLIGVPFVKADATKFSETGYVGYDVEDIVRDLLKAADNDAELAEYGIVYIDEIDKIAGKGDAGHRDVSGRGVQVNLLKLMEDADVRTTAQGDMMAQMQAMMSFQNNGETPRQTISTKHILFIVSGAFAKLPEQIAARMGKAHIGFTEKVNSVGSMSQAELLSNLQTRDLVDFGFEPEFVGRLPVRVALNELSVDDLEAILGKVENGILEQYVEDFAGYGVKLNIRHEALHEIARRAYEEKTGARGLMTVLEKLFREFKYEMPSLGMTNLTLTPQMLEKPLETLEEMKKQAEAEREKLKLSAEFKVVEAFVQEFEEMHDLHLTFTDGAVEKLFEQSCEQGMGLAVYLRQQFQNAQHGLRLIGKKLNTREFEFDEKKVADVEASIADWVTSLYQP